MKYQTRILIFSTLLVLAQSLYIFKNTYNFKDYTISSFILAPSIVLGINYNLALGLSNGSVVLTSTEITATGSPILFTIHQCFSSIGTMEEFSQPHTIKSEFSTQRITTPRCTRVSSARLCGPQHFMQILTL